MGGPSPSSVKNRRVPSSSAKGMSAHLAAALDVISHMTEAGGYGHGPDRSRPPYDRSMASARPRGPEEVIAAVLESARELIAERGPGVALRDIADGAGVNFGLLYHYLGTKEQL